MKKQLYLTRHGETQWNTVRRMQGQKNSPLTELGVKQARWLAESLHDTRIDVIYSSPLGRAYNTAKIIAEAVEAPIITRDELKELYFGSWEGQLKEDLEKQYKETDYHFWNEPDKYIPTDGETLDQLIDRSRHFFEEVLVKSEHENILVVAHAIVLKSFLNLTQNKEIKDLWTGPNLKPTSLTKANMADGELIYEFIGDTSHYKEHSSFNGWFK